MQNDLTTLKNGLKVLFVNSKGASSGSVQIWFRAGSALETSENEGIAHFLEHMFFKGTNTRPGAKIAYDVESFGGEINAFTSFDYTCYYINCPGNHLKTSTEILLDMVSNPMFLESDLVPERGVVFEEYRRSIDSSNQFGFKKLQDTAFTGSYAHPILGNEDTIKNFSKDQLENFRNNFYNKENCLLIVSGNLSEKEDLIKSIEKFNLPKGNASSFPEFSLKKVSNVNVHTKEVRMSTLTICTEAPDYQDPKAAAEDLAINCIGFGESSHLYRSLVLEKTLANSASASTMFMSKGGAHFIRISFPHESFQEVSKRLITILKNISNTEISNEEISKIKKQYLSSKIYERESIESYSFSLGHSFAQTGNINADDDFINRIKACTPFQVNKALGNIFTKVFHLSLQIPKNENEKKANEQLKMLQKNLVALKTLALKKNKLSTSITESKFDPAAKLVKIKSGVSLFYRQNSITPTFVLQAYLRGGLTEENSKNNGSYHLLNGLLTKGYGKVTNEKLKKDLEEKSASMNGFSGKNAYGILMHGLSENFTELSAHFTSSLLTPNISSKDLKHDKLLTLRALSNQEEDATKHCFKEVNKTFFNDHPYSLNPLGEKNSIKTITDTKLKNIHKGNLKKKEILITYCGSDNLEDVLSILAPLFEKLPSRPSQKLKIKKYKPKLVEMKHIQFDREQTQIFIGIPCGTMKDKENFYLKLLTTHLSGQSSELFVEVRDRQGLCYSTQPIHFSALEGGYFGIYMASGHDKVQKAILAINSLLEKIKNNGLEEEYFNRIKDMIKGQNQVNIQTNEDYASIYSVPILQGEGMDYYHNKNIEIDKLTHAEFQKNIKAILSKKWSTIIVGRSEAKTKEI